MLGLESHNVLWYTKGMPEVTSIIQNVLRATGIAYTEVQHSEVAGQTIYNIKTDDSSLAHAHGDVVQALDHVVKKIIEQQKGVSREEGEEQAQFSVDINGLRAKHIQDLKAKALIMAERARSFQYDVELTPMSSYERLIIHTVLSDAPHIKTESQGEGRGRRVVIRYAP